MLLRRKAMRPTKNAVRASGNARISWPHVPVFEPGMAQAGGEGAYGHVMLPYVASFSDKSWQSHFRTYPTDRPCGTLNVATVHRVSTQQNLSVPGQVWPNGTFRIYGRQPLLRDLEAESASLGVSGNRWCTNQLMSGLSW